MTSRVFTFDPAGFDRFFPHGGTPPEGTKVRKCQPYGCPKNGTMGHCYVEDAETGEFYGLVQVSSLVRKVRTEPKPPMFTVVTGSPNSLAFEKPDPEPQPEETP